MDPVRILHIIDSLDYNGSAAQLRILGPALNDDDVSVEIGCLGPETPWLRNLRDAGVVVHSLGWTRWFDPSVLWNLRSLLRESAPDVIHVWRLPALRTLAAVASNWLPRVVMSAPLPISGVLAWWDKRLLERVGLVAVAGESDRQRCLQQGVARPDLRVVPPALQKRCQEPLSKGPDTFSITCVGPLDREHGIREAIWAFDFVRYVFPHVMLRIVGGGPQRAMFETLTRGMQSPDSVQFVGPRTDLSDLFGDDTIVWIPSKANCGRQTALQAMAHGKAVIASNVPALGDLIDDGGTGFLIAPGDVIQLARRTSMLLKDSDLRDRIGAAARAKVERQFPLTQTVAQWRELYRRVAA